MLDEEVAFCIARASTAFGKLQDKVWNHEGLSSETKLEVYRAVVLPSLLYASETYTLLSTAMLLRSQLKWAGLVVQMPDEHLSLMFTERVREYN